ncbi:TPA: hypothetical protein N0F65_000833, partial [Lagenidium giganteum]
QPDDDVATIDANFEPLPDAGGLSPRERATINDFVLQRQSIVRYVRDAIADAVDAQKEYADRTGRRNMEEYAVGDEVLLSTDGQPLRLVSHAGTRKLLPKFIGPFKITRKKGNAYTLRLSPTLRLHPTFYVGRLKRYYRAHQAEGEDSHNEVRDDAWPQPARHQPSSGGDLPSSGGDAQRPPGGLAAAHSRPSALQSRQRWRPPSAPPRPPSSLLDEEGSQRFLVDRLVGHEDRPATTLARGDHRRRRLHLAAATVRFYRVRWVGHPAIVASWESRQHLLEDVPGLVAAYEQPLDAPRRA